MKKKSLVIVGSVLTLLLCTLAFFLSRFNIPVFFILLIVLFLFALLVLFLLMLYVRYVYRKR